MRVSWEGGLWESGTFSGSSQRPPPVGVLVDFLAGLYFQELNAVTAPKGGAGNLVPAGTRRLQAKPPMEAPP